MRSVLVLMLRFFTDKKSFDDFIDYKSEKFFEVSSCSIDEFLLRKRILSSENEALEDFSSYISS